MTGSVGAALEDLHKFTAVMDDCGVVYGRRYRAALDRLRTAINKNAGSTVCDDSKNDIAEPLHADGALP